MIGYDWLMNRIEEDESLSDFTHAPRESIERYTKEACTFVQNYALTNNVWYGESWRNSLPDGSLFEVQPLLLKSHIQSGQADLCCVVEEQIAQYHLTSGTTGEPLITGLTYNDLFVHDFKITYPTLFNPSGRHCVVGIALPYEFSQAGPGFHRMYQTGLGHTVVGLGKGGYLAPTEKMVAMICRLNVSLLVTTPSYAATLIEEIEKQRLTHHVHTLLLTGEGASAMFIKRLRRAWGNEIIILQAYGSTECGLIGVKRDDEEYFTILEGHVHVEIVNRGTNIPVDGESMGDVVVTSLLREGTPFLRYQTGDVGFFPKIQRKDGVTLKQFKLVGRAGSLLLVQNKQFHPLQLEDALLTLSQVGLWYEIHVDGNEATVVCEWNELQSRPEAEQLIQEQLFEKTGINFRVQIVDRVTRQQGKAVRVFVKS
ncbi:MAG: phenylacetate--CoA ligase family protein [Bacilli bacterium]